MSRNDLPHVIDLRHVRLVVALSDHGTVTAAAQALALSQSALSHQLRELEGQLRTTLYVRTPRRMVPTAAGEQLASVARRVASDLRNVELQMKSGRFSEARGQIRLVAETHTTYHWLPTVLRNFGELWPGIQVHIRPEFANTVADALRDGTVDMGIVQSGSVDQRILTRFLFDDSYVVAIAPRHRLQERPFAALEDIATEHLLVNGAGPETPIMQDVLRPAGVVPRQVTFMPLTDALLEMVAADAGIAIVAKWAATPWIASGRIRVLPLTDRGVTRRWYVATRRDEPTSLYHQRFIELAAASVAGQPPAAQLRKA